MATLTRTTSIPNEKTVALGPPIDVAADEKAGDIITVDDAEEKRILRKIDLQYVMQ